VSVTHENVYVYAYIVLGQFGCVSNFLLFLLLFSI
jgi:hypothetical protein